MHERLEEQPGTGLDPLHESHREHPGGGERQHASSHRPGGDGQRGGAQWITDHLCTGEADRAHRQPQRFGLAHLSAQQLTRDRNRRHGNDGRDHRHTLPLGAHRSTNLSGHPLHAVQTEHFAVGQGVELRSEIINGGARPERHCSDAARHSHVALTEERVAEQRQRCLILKLVRPVDHSDEGRRKRRTFRRRHVEAKLVRLILGDGQHLELITQLRPRLGQPGPRGDEFAGSG